MKTTFALLALSLVTPAALAQGADDYPNRPVRVMAPSGPGGGVDIQSRLFARVLAETMQRVFVVENLSGVGGARAYVALGTSKPDGYTLSTASTSVTYLQVLYPSALYNPDKDFAPISQVSKSPYLLSVHPDLPAKTVKELVALAKARPGSLHTGVSSGSLPHLAMVLFAQEAGIEVVIVPYGGGSASDADYFAGRTQFAIGSILSGLASVRAGRTRAIALSATERSPKLPDVPTIRESGVNVDLSSWFGFLAPAGTPAAIVNKLNAELNRVAKSAAVLKVLEADGGVAVGTTPQEFLQLIQSQGQRLRKVVQDNGFKGE